MAVTKAWTHLTAEEHCLYHISLGYYVKYDDLIRRAPGTGGKIWQAIVGSNSRHVDSREVAIRQLLPKWTGFYCADVSDIKLITMLADEALTDLSEVVHQLKFPLVQENVEGSQPFPWHLDGLDVSKVSIFSLVLRRFIT